VEKHSEKVGSYQREIVGKKRPQTFVGQNYLHFNQRFKVAKKSFDRILNDLGVEGFSE
jgi:DNA-directed RNA polymerase subunit N (RpoN/RPB10)